MQVDGPKNSQINDDPTNDVQPQQTSYNGQTIAAIVPGEQGRQDAVIYDIPPEKRVTGYGPVNTISVPDPMGNRDASGNIIPQSAYSHSTVKPSDISVVPDEATRANIIKNSQLPENIDAYNLTNPYARAVLTTPTFTPGKKIRIDNLPQGGDFQATRNYLLNLPTGTRVQIGDSSNENVYVYYGGLAGQLDDDPELDYYPGYGGVTTNMAAAYKQKQIENAVKNNEPYAQSYKKDFPNLMGPGSEIRNAPAFVPEKVSWSKQDIVDIAYGGGSYDSSKDRYAAPVYIGGFQVDPVLSRLSRLTSDASATVNTGAFAVSGLLGGGFVGDVAGGAVLLAGTPAIIADVAVKGAALIEVYSLPGGIGRQAATQQISQNLITNTPAFVSSVIEHPGMMVIPAGVAIISSGATSGIGNSVKGFSRGNKALLLDDTAMALKKPQTVIEPKTTVLDVSKSGITADTSFKNVLKTQKLNDQIGYRMAARDLLADDTLRASMVSGEYKGADPFAPTTTDYIIRRMAARDLLAEEMLKANNAANRYVAPSVTMPITSMGIITGYSGGMTRDMDYRKPLIINPIPSPRRFTPVPYNIEDEDQDTPPVPLVIQPDSIKTVPYPGIDNPPYTPPYTPPPFVPPVYNIPPGSGGSRPTPYNPKKIFTIPFPGFNDKEPSYLKKMGRAGRVYLNPIGNPFGMNVPGVGRIPVKTRSKTKKKKAKR